MAQIQKKLHMPAMIGERVFYNSFFDMKIEHEQDWVLLNFQDQEILHPFPNGNLPNIAISESLEAFSGEE